MKSPKQMEEKVDTYAYYMTLGILTVFLLCIIILVIHFIIGLLTFISMGG